MDEVVTISSGSENEDEKKRYVKNPFKKCKTEPKSEQLSTPIRPQSNVPTLKRLPAQEKMDCRKENGSGEILQLPNKNSSSKEVPSKKIKLQTNGMSEEKPQSTKMDTSNNATADIYANPIPGTSKQFSPTRIKPTLIIIEKKPVDAHQKTTFEKFLESCRRIESGNDMEIILEKLDKTHKKVDPNVSSSAEVIQFLQKKIMLLESVGKVYLRIREVKDFLKQRVIVKVTNGEVKESPEKQLTKEEKKRKENIRKIEKVLEKIENKIKQLEEREVDWDDEDDSAYLQEARYKERAVKLHKELCKLTGESANADRKYLKPHTLSLSGIPDLDEAISSYVYSKLPKKGQKYKKMLPEAIKFPEYLDILKCVKKYNKESKLGMNSKQEQMKAKETFKKVGEHLRNLRQLDFFETISYFAENHHQDPAEEDNDLKSKLGENRKLAHSKMNEVCEKFVIAQESGVLNLDEKNSDDESEEDDEESEKDSDTNMSNDEEENEKDKDEDENAIGEKEEENDKIEESEIKEQTKEKENEEVGQKDNLMDVSTNGNDEISAEKRTLTSPSAEELKIIDEEMGNTSPLVEELKIIDEKMGNAKPVNVQILGNKNGSITLSSTKDHAILERPKISSVKTLASPITFRTKVPMEIIKELPAYSSNLMDVVREMSEAILPTNAKVSVKPKVIRKQIVSLKREEKKKSPESEKPKNVTFVEKEKKTESVKTQNTKKVEEIQIIEEKNEIKTVNSLNEADSGPPKEKNLKGNPEIAILSPQCVIDLEEVPTTSQKPTLRVAHFAKVPESWHKSSSQKAPSGGEPEISIIEGNHAPRPQNPRSQFRGRVHKVYRNYQVKPNNHYKLVPATSMTMRNSNAASRNPGTLARRDQPSNAPLIVTKSTTIRYDPRSLELSAVDPQTELLTERLSNSIVRILSPSKVIIKSFPRR